MRIAVFGGTGNVGSAVVAEAVQRGHEVTVLSRREAQVVPDGAAWRAGDAADPDVVAETARENDVVVSALGPSRAPGEDPFAFEGVVRTMAGAVGSTRLIIVGGAGSLFIAPNVRLFDTDGFPAEYQDESRASYAALEFLRGAGHDLDWTYLSPAPEIGPGERTGRYVLGEESPAGDRISFADYAVALLDEIEHPAHHRARFTVADEATAAGRATSSAATEPN
ncbi:NAD(P)-dependent oxidoreductase [uncultured Jatrophihabitans sp.]|uniref:NAD(P)-dependent oxidoreductase n=1 Tax=uncultured Jatrophihabitans sp. TaxID=1610747 RepID=UPI0035CBABB4